MKKILFLSLSAVLVFALVVAAGCVDSQSSTDPIIGNWYYNDDEWFEAYSFSSTGQGHYTSYLVTTADDGTVSYDFDQVWDFVWSNTGDNNYALTYTDGEVENIMYNPQTGTIIVADYEFKKGTDDKVTTGDSILGGWNCKNDTLISSISFDDTGMADFTVFRYLKSDDGTQYYDNWLSYSVVCTKLGANMYVLTFDDGYSEHILLNPDTGSFYFDEAVYTKDDSIIGNWYYKDEESYETFIFLLTGFGTYSEFIAADDTDKETSGYQSAGFWDFAWTKSGDNTYVLTYDDGDVEEGVYNPDTGVFTIYETDYVKKDIVKDIRNDLILGEWKFEDDEYSGTYSFENTGFGTYVGTDFDSQTLKFVWSSNGDNMYTLTYMNGFSEHGILNAQRGMFTIAGYVFLKEPNPASGAF